MNFFDLCVACWHAIGRLCSRFGQWCARLLRITFRLWWIVLPVMALAIGAGLYYSREDNLTYKVQAVAMLNGASIEQFEQRYDVLKTGLQLPDSDPLKKALKERWAVGFESFYVVDVYNDSVADYVDYKKKSSPTDTIKVQMKDRMGLQFLVKKRHLKYLPQIEQQMLAFLNADEAMQKSYALYVRNMARAQQFNHDQMEKLDSLTSEYYFKSNPGSNPLGRIQEGMVLVGDWRVHLFLDQIYSHQERTAHMDYRAAFATAPVTLENHFVVNPKAKNAPKIVVPVFTLLGWLFGCLLAALIEQRKRIISWLRK